MIKKNEVYEMKIDDIGSQGEGVGRIDNFTIFVSGGVPGDFIKVLILKLKKNYGYAKLLEILDPSPDRVAAVCPVYGRCGGCHLQQLNYSKQLEYKQKKVENCLKRIGRLVDVTVENTIGMQNPFNYRNKAQFPVGIDSGDTTIGFYAPRSHRIIPVKNCMIQHTINYEILNTVEEFFREYKILAYDEETHIGLVRHVLTKVGFVTKEIMVCLVINGDGLPFADILIARLRQISGMTSILLNFNTEATNVILGESTRTLWGKDYINDYIGNLTFKISPLSFFQVNPVQTEILYNKVLEFASPDSEDTIIDAYCGIGTISLFLAKYAKQIYGVEIVPQAIQDAINNAELNRIENVNFILGKSEIVIPELLTKEAVAPNIIVVDPPRKGCQEELVYAILKAHPQKIIYVSCDPATLARDLQFFIQNGDYRLDKIQPVDCFPMTYHVETVVLMQRVENK